MPFAPGQSGNPGGRTGVPKEVRDLARQYTEEAIQRLVFWMQSDHPSASPAAADKLLDRAWGKPAQPVDGDGEGGAIKQLVEIRFVKPGDTQT
jgi:hypothetical protein